MSNNDPAVPPPLPAPETAGQFRIPRRTWIVWLAIFFGIIFLMFLKDRLSSGETLRQYEFQELVDAGEIAHAVIIYDPQAGALNEIVGTYYKNADGRKVEVPFRTKIRLTGDLEQKLLTSPAFEARQPNTALMSLIWSLLPIIVLVALVWFFFVRQIRKAAAGKSQITVDLNTKTAEQQRRFDNVLDKWEQQAARIDALLDRHERKQ